MAFTCFHRLAGQYPRHRLVANLVSLIRLALRMIETGGPLPARSMNELQERLGLKYASPETFYRTIYFQPLLTFEVKLADGLSRVQVPVRVCVWMCVRLFVCVSECVREPESGLGGAR